MSSATLCHYVIVQFVPSLRCVQTPPNRPVGQVPVAEAWVQSTVKVPSGVQDTLHQDKCNTGVREDSRPFGSAAEGGAG